MVPPERLIRPEVFTTPLPPSVPPDWLRFTRLLLLPFSVRLPELRARVLPASPVSVPLRVVEPVRLIVAVLLSVVVPLTVSAPEPPRVPPDWLRFTRPLTPLRLRVPPDKFRVLPVAPVAVPVMVMEPVPPKVTVLLSHALEMAIGPEPPRVPPSMVKAPRLLLVAPLAFNVPPDRVTPFKVLVAPFKVIVPLDWLTPIMYVVPAKLTFRATFSVPIVAEKLPLTVVEPLPLKLDVAFCQRVLTATSPEPVMVPPFRLRIARVLLPLPLSVKVPPLARLVVPARVVAPATVRFFAMFSVPDVALSVPPMVMAPVPLR